MNGDVNKFMEFASNSFSEEELEEVKKVLEKAVRGEFPEPDKILRELIEREGIEDLLEDINRILSELRRISAEVDII